MSSLSLTRRHFLAASLGVSAAAVLAACAPKAEEPTAAPAQAEPAVEKKEEAAPAPKSAEPINFLCRSDIKPAYGAGTAVDEWNANNEAQVVLDEPPQGVSIDMKIQAAQAAGDLVWDGYWVMVMPHDAVAWTSRQIIQPFDPFIEATTVAGGDKILDAIIPSIRESCTYEGGIVGIPGNVGSIGLAWSWEALNAVGLDRQPETWDELYETCVEIKKAKPDLIPYGHSGSPLADIWTYIWSAQADPFDENGLYDIRGEASIEGLKWHRKMIEEDLMYDSPTDAFGQWLKGGWAMIMSYDVAGTMAQAAFGTDKYETGIPVFPEKGVTNAGAPFWINSGCLLNKAKNPQGFTDFCCWWFGPDNAATGKQITEVAAKPCYTYMYENHVEGNPLYQWEKTSIDLCAESVPFPHNTTHNIQSSKAAPYCQKVLDLTIPFEPEVWMDQAYQDIQDEIAKQK